MLRNTSLAFVLLLLTALHFPAFCLPDKPVTKEIDPYFAEEIERVWSFLQTRQEHPELLLKMAIILDVTENQELAQEWYKEVEKLELPQDKLEEINRKIRKQYDLALAPVFRRDAPMEAINDEEIGQTAGSLGVSPESLALQAEANNDMRGAAKEYLRLFRQTRQSKYLALAAERYLWADESERALPLLIELNQFRPRSQQLLQQISEIAGWHGNYKMAADYLEKALLLKYGRKKHLQLISLIRRIPDRDRAIVQTKEYLKKYPMDTEGKILLAQLLLEAGEAKQALALIESLEPEKISPEQIDSLLPELFARERYGLLLRFCLAGRSKGGSAVLNLRQLYYGAASAVKLEKFAQAANMIAEGQDLLQKRSLQLDAGGKLSFRRDFMVLQAVVAQNQNESEGLFDLHREILALDPENFSSLVFLGEEYRNHSQFGKAQMMFERARKIAPKDRYILWSLADLASRTGNLYRARLLLENLAKMPDFEDEALLLELWQKTGAWGNLADYIDENSPRLLPNYRSLYIEALIKTGRYNDAATLLQQNLSANPFDEISELRFKEISGRVPRKWESYQKKKDGLIDQYHQHIVASLSIRLKENPDDQGLLRERARVYGYMSRPESALLDLRRLLRSNALDLQLLEEAAAMAEWAANSQQAWNLRRRIAELVPTNASNSLQLANLAFVRRKFALARDFLESGNALVSLQPERYFYTALPILLADKKYLAARQLLGQVSHLALSESADKDFKRFWRQNSRMISRDIGPVYRLGFNFMHDTDNVSLSNLHWFSRFAVRNQSFWQLNLEDIAMTRNANNQRGSRSRALTLSYDQGRAEEGFNLGLPLLLGDGEKVRIFTPSLGYRRLYEKDELYFDYSQLPLRDTPEALRQGLFTNRASLRWRKKTGERTWVEGRGGYQKNSAGFSGTFCGFSVEKALSYEPFRALRYSFNTEDNQSENSDLFYLEDFIQTHTLAWSGQSDFFNPKRFLDMINWDVFVGINNRNEAFHGASIRTEHPLGRRFFLHAYANYFSSQNNRFAQTGGYRNWNYGLLLEAREW